MTAPGAAGDPVRAGPHGHPAAAATDELEQARQYALGTLLLGMSTQAGLAGLASTYAGFGLRLDYLAEHAGRLAAATREDVGRGGGEIPGPGPGGRVSCSATPTDESRRLAR